MSGFWSFRNDGIDGQLKEEHVGRALGMEGIVGRELQNAGMHIDEGDDVMGLLSKLRTFVGVESPKEVHEGDEEDVCDEDDDESLAAVSDSSSTGAAITRLREMLCLGTTSPEARHEEPDEVAATMQALETKVLDADQDRSGPKLEPDTLDPRVYPSLFAVQLEAEKERVPPPVVLPDAYDITGIVRQRKKRHLPSLESMEEPTWKVERETQRSESSPTGLMIESSHISEALEPTWSVAQAPSLSIDELHPSQPSVEASLRTTQSEMEMEDTTPLRVSSESRPELSMPLPTPSLAVSPATELSVSMSIDYKQRAKPVLTPLSDVCRRSISISPLTVASPLTLQEKPDGPDLAPQFSTSEPIFNPARLRQSLPQLPVTKASLSLSSLTLRTSVHESPVALCATEDAENMSDTGVREMTVDGAIPIPTVPEPLPEPVVPLSAPQPLPLPESEVDADLLYKEALAKHFHNKLCLKHTFGGWVTVQRDLKSCRVQRVDSVVKMLRSKSRKDAHYDCMAQVAASCTEAATSPTSTLRSGSVTTSTVGYGESTDTKQSEQLDVFALKTSARREKRLKAREELQQRYFETHEKKRQEDEEKQKATEELAAQEKRVAITKKRREKAAEERAKLEKEERKKIYKAKVRRAVTHYNRAVAKRCLGGFKRNVALRKDLSSVAAVKGAEVVLRRAMVGWWAAVDQWKRVHRISFIFRCISLRRVILQCFKRGFLRRWRGVVTARKLDVINAARLDRHRVMRCAMGRWFRAASARDAGRAVANTQKADELLNTFLYIRKRRLFTQWKDKTSDVLNNKQRMLFRKRMAEAIKDIAGDVLCP